MIDFLIIGIAAAGLELAYQRLMFPNHPLHFWFKILWCMNGKLKNSLGICHICNSAWIALIIHFIIIGIEVEVLISVGVCILTLSILLNVKWLVFVPTEAWKYANRTKKQKFIDGK